MVRNDEQDHRVNRDRENGQKVGQPGELHEDRRARRLHPSSYEAGRRGSANSVTMHDSVSVVSSRRAFEGRVFDVRVDEIRYGDDPPHRIDVVEHGDSVAIAAFDDRERLVLVRQYRHAVGTEVWEIPAGSVDRGENARDAALRELREETGYTAGRIGLLTSIYPTPGFCDEIVHVFVARDLRAGERALDEDERIDVELLSSDDAWRLVTGQVSDAKTALALLWLKAQGGQMRSESGRS
jgi:8-oxo-dGTP pyrophosphatase MutT (NUDIX family)